MSFRTRLGVQLLESRDNPSGVVLGTSEPIDPYDPTQPIDPVDPGPTDPYPYSDPLDPPPSP